jgi:hypothetical protein
VFSNTLTLSFDAQPFGEGSREDGYETEGEMLARLSALARR